MPDFSDHFSTQFNTNWVHLAQQTKPRLSKFVDYDDLEGERKRYSRLDAINSNRRDGTRLRDTVISATTEDYRWLYANEFDVANLIDEWDEQKLAPLVVPSSDYVKMHAAAYNRDCDDVAWKAAILPYRKGEDGTEEGGPTRPFPGSNNTTVQKYAAVQDAQTGAITVNWTDVDYRDTVPSSGAKIGDYGLTVEKLIELKSQLDNADTDDDAPMVLVCTATQIGDLLKTTKATSADYSSVKALVNGTVNSFMGFEFVRCKRLPSYNVTYEGHTHRVRSCVAWVKGAVRVARGPKSTRMAVRDDISEALQIRSKWRLGGIRLLDDCVKTVGALEPVPVS